MRKVRAPRTGEWVYSRSIWAWPLVALLLVLCAAPALAQSRITAPGGGGSAIACTGQAATTVLYASSASQCAGDATFTFNDTTKRLSVQNETITSGLTLTGATVTGAPTWPSGQTFPNIILTGVANTALIAASGGSVTGSNTTPFFSLSGTLNTSGSLNAVDWNFTQTASGASTNLFQIRDGATNYLSLSKAGALTLTGQMFLPDGAVGAPGLAFTSATNSGLWYSGGALRAAVGGALQLYIGPVNIGITGGALYFGSADDVQLYRDAANQLAQRNNTAAQQFNLYNTWTDASNYERLESKFSSNIASIGTMNLGTGTARALTLRYGGTTTAAITIPITSGNMTFAGGITQTGVAFASLGTPADGTILYCTTCDPPAAGATAICTSAGAQTGALALRLNGGWKCVGA